MWTGGLAYWPPVPVMLGGGARHLRAGLGALPAVRRPGGAAAECPGEGEYRLVPAVLDGGCQLRPDRSKHHLLLAAPKLAVEPAEFRYWATEQLPEHLQRPFPQVCAVRMAASTATASPASASRVSLLVSGAAAISAVSRASGGASAARSPCRAA